MVGPLWATKHRAGSTGLMTCRHLEYGVHADASCLFSQQDQNPCLNQAECKRARVGGSRGKGQHGESEGATTSARRWTNRSRAPPFIDTKLNLISIVSRFLAKVEAIMKKINNRKTISVIEDMLNSGDILFLPLRFILCGFVK